MANADRPNGSGVVPYWWPQLSLRYEQQVAATQTITEGDWVKLNSSGLTIIATATAISLLGIAGQDSVLEDANTPIGVFDNPYQVGIAQCSGVASGRDLIYNSQMTPLDIEGTTGIMEINEDSTTYGPIRLVGVGNDPARPNVLSILDGAAANTRFLYTFAKHNMAGNVY